MQKSRVQGKFVGWQLKYGNLQGNQDFKKDKSAFAHLGNDYRQRREKDRGLRPWSISVLPGVWRGKGARKDLEGEH